MLIWVPQHMGIGGTEKVGELFRKEAKPCLDTWQAVAPPVE